MIRLMAALLGAAIGSAIGLGFGLGTENLVIVAAIGFVIGLTMSYETDVAFNAAQKKELSQGIDAINLVYWIAGPALKELATAREEWFQSYEMEVQKAMISEVVLDHIVNYGDIYELARHTSRIGSTPYATIRRHNRSNKPRPWRKKTLTHEVLRRSSYLLLEGGMTEPALIWYLHAAQLLKIKPLEAAHILFEEMDAMKTRRTMLKASSYEVSPLDEAADGIEPPEGIEKIVTLFHAERALLFGSLDGLALNVG